jgi:hypothetical protein
MGTSAIAFTLLLLLAACSGDEDNGRSREKSGAAASRTAEGNGLLGGRPFFTRDSCGDRFGDAATHIPRISAVRDGASWRVFADGSRALSDDHGGVLLVGTDDGKKVLFSVDRSKERAPLEIECPSKEPQRLAAWFDCKDHGLWRSDVLALAP